MSEVGGRQARRTIGLTSLRTGSSGNIRQTRLAVARERSGLSIRADQLPREPLEMVAGRHVHLVNATFCSGTFAAELPSIYPKSGVFA